MIRRNQWRGVPLVGVHELLFVFLLSNRPCRDGWWYNGRKEILAFGIGELGPWEANIGWVKEHIGRLPSSFDLISVFHRIKPVAVENRWHQLPPLFTKGTAHLKPLGNIFRIVINDVDA